MPEISLEIIARTADSEAGARLAQARGNLDAATLAALAGAFVSPAMDAQRAWDTTTTITAQKIAKDLYRLDLFGDACEDVLALLGEAGSSATAVVFWAFLSHESGYDTYAFNDGAGTWARTVFWEGSSDPAEDQKEAEDRWWASMPKPVLALWADDVPTALARIAAYKERQAVEVDHWRKFLTRHIDRDGLILKMRVKNKKARSALYRRLRAYITPPRAEFSRLADHLTALRIGHLGEDDGARYPDWSQTMKAPQALAQGMMFVEESGNYLFLGFQMEGIKPYLSGECNVSPKGNYATNLVHYFSFLSDSISGRAIHRVGGQCFANDIVAFDGHLYLQ